MSIKNVLRVGRENALTVGQVALAAGCTLQEVIDEISVMRKCGIPVCTSKTPGGHIGLYIASTEADLLRTISHMRHKIQRDEAALKDTILSYKIAYGIEQSKDNPETTQGVTLQ